MIRRTSTGVGAGRWPSASRETVLARFREWGRTQSARCTGAASPARGTSLSRTQYQQGVRAVQSAHRSGLGLPGQPVSRAQCAVRRRRPPGLYRRLAAMEGAFAGFLHLPEHAVAIASASPDGSTRPRRRRHLVQSHQGHSGPPRPIPAQRPLREHRDRRSRAQRPRPCRHDGTWAFGSCSPSSRIRPLPGQHRHRTWRAIPGRSWRQRCAERHLQARRARRTLDVIEGFRTVEGGGTAALSGWI